MNREKDIHLHRCFIKSYKKITLAIFCSFVLTFLLLTVMLVLLHTNYKISNVQLKAEFSPADCSVGGLSEQQIELLQNDPEIEWFALQQGTYDIVERNNQMVYLTRNDNAAITMVTKLLEGRLPQNEGEVVAEKWTLLNLGVEPVPDQSITITDPETGEERELNLVGILSDAYGNKKYGLLNLYSSMKSDSTDDYLAHIRFEDFVNYDHKIEKLQAELGIVKKQIRECPARENLHDQYLTDLKIISIILLIGLVVFYGVYRIATLSRAQQYGILRAIGMKKRQLYKMLLRELYHIYFISVPIGIAMGVLIAYFVMVISGDSDTEIYLQNEIVRFRLVIPIGQILICIIVVLFFISILGYLSGRKVTRPSVTDTILGNVVEKESHLFSIQQANSKTGTLFRMSCKYIFKDWKTSVVAVITMCLGVTLFTGLAYQAKTLEIYREETKEMYYLNGDYALTMLYFDNVSQGLSRHSVKRIVDLKEIVSVKTSSGLPIRVIDEDGVKRNDAYYDKYNKNLIKVHGYGKSGYDGNNQIYQSMLLGYNANALRAVHEYVIEGDFKPTDMKPDEVILFVFREDDTKNNELPGFYKEGTPFMAYHAGDEISIKYREDLQTSSNEYQKLTDVDAKYVYKTYKIAAIVSFPYMYDCNRNIYPVLITSDQYLQEIAPESRIQCMYCDGNTNMNSSQQNLLEQQLIRLGNNHHNVSTRSLISEIKQNEMFYHKQMVYIYGISMIAFILVMINMVNNLRYRMQKRTREICMLRAIGMSVAMTKRIMLFENLMLGVASVLAAFVLSHPVLKYLYKMSDMQSFGHAFHFAYMDFFLVAVGSLAICVLLSFGILKAWKTKRITEGIGRFE